MPLPRVLEPEVMDHPKEAHDYDAMDHREVNQQFVSDLLETGSIRGDVLDLGTGTAQIPIELCRQADDCQILAVDLAAHMLDQARYNVEAAGYLERIVLRQVDAKQLRLDDESFDFVMSNSIVHHIPDPRDVLREAVRVTRPDGHIFFRDLLRPADEAAVQRLVETYAGQENEHQQTMFRNSLRAALTLDEIQELVRELGYQKDEVRATSDRHWTWSHEMNSR